VVARVVIGIAVATLAAAFIGWLSVRREASTRFQWITLAIGVGFTNWCCRTTPSSTASRASRRCSADARGIYWRDPTPFYYLALFWALAGYLFVVYLLRAPFGIGSRESATTPRRIARARLHRDAHVKPMRCHARSRVGG